MNKVLAGWTEVNVTTSVLGGRLVVIYEVKTSVSVEAGKKDV